MRRKLLLVLFSCLLAVSCVLCLCACGDEPKEEQDLYYSESGLVFKLTTDYNNTLAFSVVGYKGNDSEIIIPSTFKGNNVISIENYAFYNLNWITSIFIPKSIKSLNGYYAFKGCNSLHAIYYMGDVNAWVEIDGLDALMDNLNTSKKLYINGELLTVANITTATKINSYAFSRCTSLQSVIVSDNIKTIGNGVFVMCSSLESISLPNSITSMGTTTFLGCNALANITFNDTRAKWNKISKGCVGIPYTCIIHCTDGNIK